MIVRKFLIFFFLAFASCADKADSLDLHIENPDGRKSSVVRAEVVYTESARSRGLMYRKSMDQDVGMLFVFPYEAERSFWMKNTYIPLDIIYFDKDFRLVSISKNARPHTTTKRPSEGPAKYVLEVNAGLADKWGLEKGSKLVVADELPEAL